MTKEIALHCMKSCSELHSNLCELCPIYGQTGSDHCFEDALQYVIGMLEQEPVLDKIRAEIEGYKSTVDNAISEDELKIEGMREAYADCLEIIDKYMAESEGEE